MQIIYNWLISDLKWMRLIFPETKEDWIFVIDKVFFCRYILKVNLIQIQNMQQLVKRERKRKRFFKPRMLFRFQRMVQRAPKISSSVFLIAYPVLFFIGFLFPHLKNEWFNFRTPFRQVQSKIILSKNPYCNLCSPLFLP